MAAVTDRTRVIFVSHITLDDRADPSGRRAVRRSAGARHSHLD